MLWLTICDFLTWAAAAQGVNYLLLLLAVASGLGWDARALAVATALIYLNALFQ